MSMRYIWINVVIFVAAILLGYMLILSPKIQERDWYEVFSAQSGTWHHFSGKGIGKTSDGCYPGREDGGKYRSIKRIYPGPGTQFVPEERGNMVHFKEVFEKVETFLEEVESSLPIIWIEITLLKNYPEGRGYHGDSRQLIFLKVFGEVFGFDVIQKSLNFLVLFGIFFGIYQLGLHHDVLRYEI